LYFLNRHIYRFPVQSGSAPELFAANPSETAFGGGFYGLDVDQATSEVYGSDAIDFTQHGMVYRYTPAGELKDTFQAGIVPGSFCFKPIF